MNELVRDLDPRYVPIKFDRDRRRIAPVRAVTGLCPQTDRRTDRQTNGRTDVQPDSSIPPLNFVERGYDKQITKQSVGISFGLVINHLRHIYVYIYIYTAYYEHDIMI